MKRFTLIVALTAANITALAVGCGGTRAARTTTPSAPAGPVQTTSAAGDVVPAGTVLPVRIDESIRTDDAGGAYSGQVAQDIVSRDYHVLIPRGSTAELVVVRADSGGTVGTSEIELALRSLTIRGQKYSVDSAGNTQRGEEGLGKNERTATMVGGGAVLGTVIGAIAGGGKGAAIGAAVGAAGGAAAQVLTRGREVHVPAETVLSFQIQQPIKLTG